MPALTSQTELAKQGISHLGYPLYFGNALVVFKVLGTLLLIIPAIPKKLKELAYAGFIFDFIFLIKLARYFSLNVRSSAFVRLFCLK